MRKATSPLTDGIFSEEAANCYTHFVKTSTSLECPLCKAISNGVAPSSLGNANANDPPGWAAKNWESLTKPNFIARWRRVSLCLGSEKAQQTNKIIGNKTHHFIC